MTVLLVATPSVKINWRHPTPRASNESFKTAPAPSRPTQPMISTLTPCLARSMATLAAHPPALVGMASTATNCPSGGHCHIGPQKVSSTRIPAQPTSVILLGLEPHFECLDLKWMQIKLQGVLLHLHFRAGILHQIGLIRRNHLGLQLDHGASCGLTPCFINTDYGPAVFGGLQRAEDDISRRPLQQAPCFRQSPGMCRHLAHDERIVEFQAGSINSRGAPITRVRR